MQRDRHTQSKRRSLSVHVFQSKHGSVSSVHNLRVFNSSVCGSRDRGLCVRVCVRLCVCVDVCVWTCVWMCVCGCDVCVDVCEDVSEGVCEAVCVWMCVCHHVSDDWGFDNVFMPPNDKWLPPGGGLTFKWGAGENIKPHTHTHTHTSMLTVTHFHSLTHTLPWIHRGKPARHCRYRTKTLKTRMSTQL